MKSRFFLFFFVFLCLSFALKAQENPFPKPKNESISTKKSERLAVLQIENQAKIPSSDLVFLSTLLQEEMQVKGRSKLLVMTQENILSLMPPNQQLENCVGVCEVDIGRVLGATYLVTGKLLRFGSQKNNLRLTLRLHETKNGELLSSKTIKATSIEDFESQIPNICQTLLTEAHILESLDQVNDQAKDQINLDKALIGSDQSATKNLESGIKLKNISLNLIKGGSFVMGSNLEQESPKRLVNVRDFYIAKTEITVQQYMDCVSADICNPPHWDDQTCWMWDGYKWTYGIVSNVFRQDHMPVTCVSWHEAKKFAQWIGGDLPTEAQWEYAAKSGGKEHQYPWGNDEPSCQKLNYNYTCISATSPVCSTPQGNTLQGLCDMSGNVYEWVLDDWFENHHGAPNHELARCKSPTCEIKDDGMKLYRGGSWIHLSTYATTSFRYGDKANSKSLGLGFRIVKSIQK